MLDGFELHLNEAPKDPGVKDFKRENDHLDATAGVDDVETFYEHRVEKGATIIKALAPTTWGTKNLYIEEPDGYIALAGNKNGDSQDPRCGKKQI